MTPALLDLNYALYTPKARATCISPNRFHISLAGLMLFPLPGTPFPAPTLQWRVCPRSFTPTCPSPRSSLCSLVSSVTAPIQLRWLSVVHGSAWSPSLRAQSVSCPFCVPGVLCEQVLGLSAERIGQWLLEESWVRTAGVWPEGPLVESLGCGEETRAVARNLGQGLRSGESRPCSPVGG